MKNELQNLIEELQKEHDYLESELNHCLEGWDFEGAATFKEPLLYTKEKLRILQNLNNSNFDKIVNLRGRIKWFKELEGKDDLSKFRFQRIKEKIPEYKRELSHLENKKKRFQYDTDELTICLKKIIQKEIRKIELKIDTKEIIFELWKEESNLKIKISRSDKHELDYTITSNGINELKKMGFFLSKENAIKEIKQFTESKIHQIIELLSRIIFEVLRLYGDRNGQIKLY